MITVVIDTATHPRLFRPNEIPPSIDLTASYILLFRPKTAIHIFNDYAFNTICILITYS